MLHREQWQPRQVHHLRRHQPLTWIKLSRADSVCCWRAREVSESCVKPDFRANAELTVDSRARPVLTESLSRESSADRGGGLRLNDSRTCSLIEPAIDA